MRRTWSIIGSAIMLLALAAPAYAGEYSDSKCGGTNVDALSEESIERTSDGKGVTAAFKVNEACQGLDVSIAIHEFSRAGETDKLIASKTATFDGGTEVRELTTTVPGCDFAAYLVTGSPSEDLVDYASETRAEKIESFADGDACKANNEPIDEDDNSGEPEEDTTPAAQTPDENLPFTGSATVPTMVAGFALLLGGVLAAWAGRYRGARARR